MVQMKIIGTFVWVLKLYTQSYSHRHQSSKIIMTANETLYEFMSWRTAWYIEPNVVLSPHEVYSSCS